MIIASSLKSLVLTTIIFLGLLLPMDLAAQTLPAGATANADRCLGYDLPYKNYPRALVNQIQADLFQLYQHDPEWKSTAGQSGRPLNDGLLGPITWSWMQRLCGQFALQQAADIVAEFPPRLQALANFSKTHSAEATQLVSKAFSSWSAANPNACQLNVRTILYRGSDAELLQLLRCYQDSLKPAAAQPRPVVPAKPKAHSLYVLRADDFTALEKPDGLVALVNQLTKKSFVDQASAINAINDLLKDQSEETRNSVRAAILAKLQSVETYQLNDEILASLFKSGIGDALFVELKAVPQTPFTSEATFKTAINAAIQKSQLVENPQQTKASTSSLATSVDNQSSSSEADNSNDKSAEQKARANLLLIVLASKQNNLVLTNEAAQSIVKTISHFPPRLIQLLKVLQDIEYPEGELLHHAIQNKLIKGLLICKVDKPNTLDINVDRLSATEKEELRSQLASIFPSSLSDSDELPICNDTHYENIQREYDKSLRSAIEQVYSEPMPEYKPLDILWNGAACGCVPKEIATTAYGIYPYWLTGEKEQEFDFSTFSRVAYFGLTVNQSGHLVQINAKSQAQTLVQDHADKSKAFISTARRYGSKVDWIIEKDWSAFTNDSIAANPMQLEVVLNNLKLNIVTLLDTPLTDAESVTRPYLSLGLAGKPTNGDGVTLYFKNYPDSDAAKKIFASFFTAVKKELKNLSGKHASLHRKQPKIYLNLMVGQSDFTADEGVFTSTNIEQLIKTQDLVDTNLSLIEMQDRLESVVLLVLEEPYYNALDEIYALTSGTSRSVIMPMMIANYADMNRQEQREALSKGMASDERFKKLAYIHESFGGGGFWPITTWNKPGYEGFNDYVATHFAPGYSKSGWNEKLCAYRWQLISVMNIWLVLALIFVVVAFYIYPHKCRELPSAISWLLKPFTLIILLLPPIILWDYLLLVDSQFPLLSLSSLLNVLLIVLSLWAVLDSIKELKKQKPNRNLLQHQKIMAVPNRSINTVVSTDEIDDTDVSDSNK